MLSVRVKVDGASALLALKKGEKRLVYALSNSTNDTLKLAQRVIQDEVTRDRFTVRKTDFIRREAAKILFSSPRQGRAFGEIYVGQKPRLFLSTFEEGGERPRRATSVAVPLTGTAARPTFGESVPTSLYLKRLFSSRGRKKGRVTESTTGSAYKVEDVGVFLREGEESSLIYAFDEDVQLDRRLGFRDTVQRVAEEWHPRFLAREVEKELRRAGL